MIADRLLARLRVLVGFVPTRWSLVRIACVAVLGLVVAGYLVPAKPGRIEGVGYNRLLDTGHSRVVSLPLGDTRGFRVDPHPHRFRIAWIGGSEMLGVRPGHLTVVPGLVNDRIRRVDGRRTTTDIYFLNAIRVADELAALKRALASKPDVVVVSLNPVWVLNDLAVQQWGYLDGILARRSVWPPSSWPVAASLVSPGDAGWRVLSAASRAVADRLGWGTSLSSETDGWSLLHDVPGGTEPPPTGLGVLAQSRPVDFWHSHNDAAPADASLVEQQLTILERELKSTSGLNVRVLKEMFASVRRAGVAAYFYMSAIAPEMYAAPDGHRYLDELRERLADATRGETTGRVLFDPRGLQDRVPPTKYQDIVHKLNPGPEVRVLTSDLCALLDRQGHHPECEQP